MTWKIINILLIVIIIIFGVVAMSNNLNPTWVGYFCGWATALTCQIQLTMQK